MSFVGRTCSPSGATSRRPRAVPAMTRNPLGRLTPGTLRARARCRAGRQSRLEEEFDGVAEELADLVAQLGVAGEVGVAVEDLLGDRPRVEDDLLVARDAPELEVAETRLPFPEDLTRAADLEVLLREREAVGARDHRREALFAVVGTRVGEQEAVGAVATATDTTAELMQLRQAEAIGILDDHDGRVRHIDTDLDHRRGDEHVDLAAPVRTHHGLF